MYRFEVIDMAKVIVHQQKPVPDTIMLPSFEIYEDCSSHFPLINNQYPSSCTCKNSIQMIINCSRKHIFTSCSLLWIGFYTYNPVNDRKYDVITPYIQSHNTLYKNRFRSIGFFFLKMYMKGRFRILYLQSDHDQILNLYHWHNIYQHMNYTKKSSRSIIFLKMYLKCRSLVLIWFPG